MGEYLDMETRRQFQPLQIKLFRARTGKQYQQKKGRKPGSKGNSGTHKTASNGRPLVSGCAAGYSITAIFCGLFRSFAHAVFISVFAKITLLCDFSPPPARPRRYNVLLAKDLDFRRFGI
jgi:hypothetical protein